MEVLQPPHAFIWLNRRRKLWFNTPTSLAILSFISPNQPSVCCQMKAPSVRPTHFCTPQIVCHKNVGACLNHRIFTSNEFDEVAIFIDAWAKLPQQWTQDTWDWWKRNLPGWLLICPITLKKLMGTIGGKLALYLPYWAIPINHKPPKFSSEFGSVCVAFGIEQELLAVLYASCSPSPH